MLGFDNPHRAVAISDHTSLTTGADWLPVWSFHDASNGQLVVGRCTDARCTSIGYTVVDPRHSLAPGEISDSGILGVTAIGADGKPIVLYMNGGWMGFESGLWLAQCDDTACTSSTRQLVDPDLSDFHRFDVQVGSDGLPIIAKFHWALDVLHCADAACSTGTSKTIQTWTDDWSGWSYPSLVIGTDGLPNLAYNDLTVTNGGTPNPIHNESLKFVHCHDTACSSWTTTKIVDGRTEFVSADIGGDGLPFIAYRASGVLNVAHCKDVACTSSEIINVDPGPAVGSFTSLATDPLGMPMIAYIDEANFDLKVARLGRSA